MTEVKVEEREKVGAGKVFGADAETAGLPAVRVETPGGGYAQWDPNEELKREPLYNQVGQQMLGVLRAKWRGLKEEEIAQALEVAGALRLNPWTDEIYAGKSQGRDGEEGRLLIMVGRNGLLRKAEEFPDYKGYDSGIVYANDVFERVDPDPEGNTLRKRGGVIHRQGHPKDRGELIGAWALAERAGRPPRYFFALWGEYDRGGKTPWSKTRAAMIEKVPISMTHRTLINLSGVYLEEEVDHVLHGEGDFQELSAEVGGAISWPQTPEGERIRLAYLRLGEAAPGAWPPAKMELIIPSLRTQEEQATLADQMEREAGIAEDRNRANEPVLPDTPAPEEPAAEVAEPAGEPKAEEPDASGSDSASMNEEPKPEPDRPFKGVDAAKLRRDLETIDAELARADPEDGDVDISSLEGDKDAIEAELRIRAGEEPGQEKLL